jgi:hypothetical protein
MYVPSVVGDIEHHKKIHESTVNGVQIRISNRESVVQKKDNYQLVVIDSNSTLSQFNRLGKLSKFISSSLFRDHFTYHVHLSYPIVPEHKFFLLCTKNRIIGYLDIEFFPEMAGRPVWIIKMIWLAINYRNKGLAKFIVESSLHFLGTDLSSVGWESPFSKMGLLFVQSLCPDGYKTFIARH